MGRSLFGCAVVLAFLLSTVSVGGQEVEDLNVDAPAAAPSGEAVVVDLLFVRPLSLAALVIGSAISIVALPFALASGTTGAVYEKLVVEPYAYAVCRPLGDFD